MQLQELNALLARSDQFAISPTPINWEIPYGHAQNRGRRIRPVCPLGLIRATVIDTKADWTEQVAFGCAGKTHPVERKTGVLVHVKVSGLEADDVALAKLVKSKYVEQIDNTGVLKMVVARKALLMPWSDYKPVRDARRKSAREAARRQARMDAATSALGADRAVWNSTYENGKRIYKAADATITLSLPRAEQLADLLRQNGLIGDQAEAA